MILPTWRSWIRRLSRRRPARPPRKASAIFRPQIEDLETRWLPTLNTSVFSSLTVAGGSFLSGLTSFHGNDGQSPQGNLFIDSSGNLYGTASAGGSGGGFGTIFKLAKGASSVTTLASFNGSNGYFPRSGLIADASGNLYGVTGSSGGNDFGTIFKLANGSSTVTTLATFDAYKASPVGGLVRDASGNLFGVTMDGGASGLGSVFELVNGTGSITRLASFTASTGSQPGSGLVLDATGNLYGTTQFGGAGGGVGTIFKLAKGSSTITTLATFNNANGAQPQGDLIRDAAGNLFGTTATGGAYGKGTIFELVQGSNVVTTLSSFHGDNGAQPQARLYMDAEGNLFGTTLTGGANNAGTIFELARGSQIITTLASLGGTPGAGPSSALIADATGNLYGITQAGGTASAGAIFELPATGPITVTYGTNLTMAGHIGAAGGSPSVPAGETVTVSIGSVNQNTVTDASGNFRFSFDTSGVHASVSPYIIGFAYAGDAQFSSASANSSHTLLVNRATPSMQVVDPSGGYSGSAFTATATVAGVTSGDSTPAASLQNVTPTLTYYAGSTATGTPLAGAPMLPGTYTVKATFAGSTDYLGGSATTTFVIGPLSVSSITLAAASPTIATSLDYAVQFSAPVTGLAASNFQLLANGLTGATITNVTGSGKSWTVTASPGTGTGTLKLNMINSTGVTDSIGDPVATVPYSGPTYTVVAPIAPVLTGATAATFPVGLLDAFTVTATGSPPPIFSMTGALPSGVTFDPATGLLSGTPAKGSNGSYPLVFKASNGVGQEVSENFTLTVGQTLPQAVTPFGLSTGFTNSSGAAASLITRGPDGNLWLTGPNLSAANKWDFVRVSNSGALAEFITTDSHYLSVYATGITAGPDGNVWFVGNGVSSFAPYTTSGVIGYVTPAGAMQVVTTIAGNLQNTAFPQTNVLLQSITLGPDGNFWFPMLNFADPATLPNAIARITPSGTITPFTLPAGIVPGQISAGPDGNLWFTEGGANYPSSMVGIGRITPAGAFTSFTNLPAGAAFGSTVSPSTTIAPGSDGNVWFVQRFSQDAAASAIGRIDPTGVTTTFLLPHDFVATGLAQGADGNLWFTATHQSPADPGSVYVGRVSPTGEISLFPTLLTNLSSLSSPALGSDGNIWFADGPGLFRSSTFEGPGLDAPEITSLASTTFVVGTPSSFQVTAMGAPDPVLSETGVLPTGISFDPITGLLSGTPPAGDIGVYTFTFAANNGVGAPVTQTFTLTVAQAPSITSADKTTFTAGTAGAFAVTSSGFPQATYSKTGALPAGVTLNTTTGSLSGTPQPGTGGVYPLTITASNGIGTDAQQSFTLTVNEAPKITSNAGATFTVGVAGSFTVITTGFPVATLQKAGNLPTGLSFDPATGKLTGTPAAGTAGTYALTFTASNGIGTNATQNFTLTVNQIPAITSAGSAALRFGVAGSFQVKVTGSPKPALSENGALPAGVTFNAATGLLSGTPARGSGGTYNITFMATNGAGTPATQNFALTVTEPPAISSTGTVFVVGKAGSFKLATLGFPKPTFTFTGALPAGISFNGTTGTLSGTPTVAGVFPLTITARNALGAAAKAFTLTVYRTPAIVSANNIAFKVGALGSFTVAASGFPRPTFIRSGALPAGVSFNTTTGVLTGVPLAGTAGVYPITITARNGVNPDAVQNFTLTVNQSPSFTSAAGATFVVGTAGSFTVTAKGSPKPTLSMTGVLPAGVTFDPSTGILSGTPAAGKQGIYRVTFTAKNVANPVAVQSFTLTVHSAPTFASADNVTFKVGVAGTFRVVVTGFPAPTLTFTGTLPRGVTFNATTRTFSGTPAAGTAGTYTITFTAKNGINPQATQTFTLNVVLPTAI